MSAPLSFTLPLRTESTLNQREHPMARARRHAAHAEAVGWLAPKVLPAPLIEVRLTRLGVQQLDSDNLQGSLKAVRDAVAKWLRVDDATTLVRWTYHQEPVAPGAEAVRVEVEAVEGGLTTVAAWERVKGPPRARKPRAQRQPQAEQPAVPTVRELIARRKDAPQVETPAERLRRMATSATRRPSR